MFSNLQICLTIHALVFIHLSVSASVQMTRNESERECTERGGLVPHDQVSTYVNRLNDGESAWVSGYAKFSSLMAWHGCFHITKDGGAINKHTIKRNSLYLCSEKCPSTRYFGLRGKVCYCISYDDRSLLLHDKERKDAECSEGSETMLTYNYQQTTVLTSVYELISPNMLKWPTGDQQSLKQCVYVKMLHAYNVRYYTASCHTHGPEYMSGSICANSANSGISDKCQEMVESRTLCVVLGSVSWTEAFQRCQNVSGILGNTGSVDKAKLYKKLLNTRNYWTGIFRSFRIFTVEQSDVFACLAVVRVGRELVLDVDNCMVTKYPLCKLNGDNSETTPNKPTTGYTTGDGASGATQLYVIVTIALISAIIVIVVAAVIIVKKKRKLNSQRSGTLIENESDFTSDGNRGNAFVNASEVNDNENDNDTQETRPSRKLKPSKPLRHTLKRQQMNISAYENVKFKAVQDKQGKRKSKSEKPSESDYDKINLNAKGQSNHRQAHSDTDQEFHIYDRTHIENEHDNYDTMKSVKSIHSAGGVDGTYSRTVIQSTKTSTNPENNHKGKRANIENKVETKYAFCVVENEDELDQEFEINENENIKTSDNEQFNFQNREGTDITNVYAEINRNERGDTIEDASVDIREIGLENERSNLASKNNGSVVDVVVDTNTRP